MNNKRCFFTKRSSELPNSFVYLGRCERTPPLEPMALHYNQLPYAIWLHEPGNWIQELMNKKQKSSPQPLPLFVLYCCNWWHTSATFGAAFRQHNRIEWTFANLNSASHFRWKADSALRNGRSNAGCQGTAHHAIFADFCNRVLENINGSVCFSLRSVSSFTAK